MFAFCLPGVLTGDVMEVCFGGVGSQYPIPKIIYHKYPVSLGYFVQISRNCFWTNIPYSNINVKCPKIESIPASLSSYYFLFFFFVFVLISKTDGKRFEQLIIIQSKKTLMVQ